MIRNKNQTIGAQSGLKKTHTYVGKKGGVPGGIYHVTGLKHNASKQPFAKKKNKSIASMLEGDPRVPNLPVDSESMWTRSTQMTFSIGTQMKSSDRKRSLRIASVMAPYYTQPQVLSIGTEGSTEVSDFSRGGRVTIGSKDCGYRVYEAIGLFN